MKAKIILSEGKTREIELPNCFSEKIREDICQKHYEAVKSIQPYAPFILAGMQYSASGNIKHGRRKWKTSYGKGISRVPRKILWRRGTQFYWIGATVSGTVGGRRAHPPKIRHFLKEKKINKKERKLAICSALSATVLPEYLKKRYSSLQDKEIKLSLPFVADSSILKLKTKEFFKFLEKNLQEVYYAALQKKAVRAGKGKRRGRKYKKSAGLLIVIGEKEEFRNKGFEVKKSNELSIKDLFPLGRIVLYSEEAIKEIGKRWGEGKEK